MGHEQNERLQRRLQDSIYEALRVDHAGRLLVTDIEQVLGQAGRTLVEVLNEDGTEVIAQFLVRPRMRPEVPRYRELTSHWPVE